jgi:hypothetical protein
MSRFAGGQFAKPENALKRAVRAHAASGAACSGGLRGGPAARAAPQRGSKSVQGWRLSGVH